MISIIVAMADNRVIGKDNRIPWDLPEDRRKFREVTMGHTLIMGRRTFESIGGPLPGRKSIVLSRNPLYRAPDCLVAPDLASAIGWCKDDQEVFICGGGEVYRQALPIIDRIYLTVVHVSPPGDTFFPPITEPFTEISREDLAGTIPASFTVLQRRT